MRTQKGFAWLPVLIALVAVLGISGGAYFYTHQNNLSLIDISVVQKSSCTLDGKTYLDGEKEYYTEPHAIDVMPITDLLVCQDGRWFDVQQETYVTPKEQTTTSVPGMSKYTDSDFGFSFWYPSGWQIVSEDVPTTGTDREWDLKYIRVGNRDITLTVRRPMDDGSFFVEPNVVLIPAARYGVTMGNLTSYDSLSVFSKTYRILSVLLDPKIAIFAGWNTVSGSSNLDPRPLLKTIVPTNSTFGVASAAEQNKIIEAEKAAYAGQ